MKLTSNLLISAILVLGLHSVASASCYQFSNSGKDFGVCVKGSGGNAEQKAKNICASKFNNCGYITGTSSHCDSSAGKCYNENGKASKKLSNYY